MARLIDGKAVAKALRSSLKREVQDLTQRHGRPPALGLIMVGDRKDSAMYVKTKHTACKKTGIRSLDYVFDENISETTVLNQIKELNEDPTIDGILLQLPLPDQMDPQAMLDEIRPSKDVDGLHPFNVGELTMRGRYPYLLPCTAQGILALLDHAEVELEGKTAVVIGRSNLVGTPVTMLLQKRNATVIQCHKKSDDIAQYTRQADVVVAACGQPYLVKGDWIKPGATVIDVGINFVTDDPQQDLLYHGQVNRDGYKLVGDVHFDQVKQIAGALTPVPGGVGPMTIAMLLRNVVEAYKRHTKA